MLLAWALIFNLTALPATMWLKAVRFFAFPFPCLLRMAWEARRRPPPSFQGACV